MRLRTAQDVQASLGLHRDERNFLMATVNKPLPALDYELSLACALCTGAVPSYCYANAWHTLEALAQRPEVFLVEGWLVWEQTRQITLLEHGWCAWGDALLDPSMVLLVRQSQCSSLFYVPGVIYSWSDLQQVAYRDLPVVRSCGQFGPEGMGHPMYRAAYERARCLAMQLGEACSPPKPVVVQPSVAPSTDGEQLRLVVQFASSQDLLHPGGKE
jgi:hypothetical protein